MSLKERDFPLDEILSITAPPFAMIYPLSTDRYNALAHFMINGPAPVFSEHRVIELCGDELRQQHPALAAAEYEIFHNRTKHNQRCRNPKPHNALLKTWLAEQVRICGGLTLSVRQIPKENIILRSSRPGMDLIEGLHDKYIYPIVKAVMRFQGREYAPETSLK